MSLSCFSGPQKKLLCQRNWCWLSMASAKRCFAHLDFSQEQVGEAEAVWCFLSLHLLKAMMKTHCISEEQPDVIKKAKYGEV